MNAKAQTAIDFITIAFDTTNSDRRRSRGMRLAYTRMIEDGLKNEAREINERIKAGADLSECEALITLAYLNQSLSNQSLSI